MHWLSTRNRDEFLATPQLVRFDYVQGHEAFEPTLLIKANVLILKYIFKGAHLKFVATHVCGDHLLYGIQVFDDPEKPAFLWSVMESQNEQKALFGLADGMDCQIFLFNELALNVAGAPVNFNIASSRIGSLASSASTDGFDHRNIKFSLDSLLTRIKNFDDSDPQLLVININRDVTWRTLKNVLVTNQGRINHLNPFDLDEGRYQEKVITWLSDNLNPEVFIDQPKIWKGGRFRELTDAIISYFGGTFIFESKSLSLLDKIDLPDRNRLSKTLIEHIKKAGNQLKGAIRQLKSNVEIFDETGKPQPVERQQPTHCIILIPDLMLLPEGFGTEIMESFMGKCENFIHIVDPSELLRIIQTTEEIARRSESRTISHMMAFDSCLIRRAEYCIASGSLNTQIITHFVEE